MAPRPMGYQCHSTHLGSWPGAAIAWLPAPTAVTRIGVLGKGVCWLLQHQLLKNVVHRAVAHAVHRASRNAGRTFGSSIANQAAYLNLGSQVRRCGAHAVLQGAECRCSPNRFTGAARMHAVMLGAQCSWSATQHTPVCSTHVPP